VIKCIYCKHYIGLPTRLLRGLQEEKFYVDKINTPLRFAFRAREGVEGVSTKENPSVLRFQRGRGLLTKKTPPSRNSSKGEVGGGVSTEETTPPSRVLSEGGVEGVLTKKTPLLLAFRARKGLEVVACQQRTPPSRNSSEGGVC